MSDIHLWPRARAAVRGVTAAAALALALMAAPAGAQPPTGGASDIVFHVREFSSKGQTLRYAVYVPHGYPEQQKWPAIVFLHGSGEWGTDGRKPTEVGLGAAIMKAPQRWPFVVIFPQKPSEEIEWEEREDIVYEVLKRVKSKYRIDPDRIALTGISQGGHGAWYLAARNPDVWSCVVPVCGYGRARTVAPRIWKLPVWAFHGLKDDLVDPKDTQDIVGALRYEREKRGHDPEGARLTLYPEANHNSWDPAYAEPALPEWIQAQRRGR
jgi:predicted peptidase